MARWFAENLLLGDCLDILRRMPDAFADSLVTDPPGVLSMGEWDGDRGGRQAWIAWLADRLREARRVVKPGSNALVWAHARTSHWTGIALEDAGWTVVDSIQHIMGNGYRKGRGLKPAHEVWWLARNGDDGGVKLNIEECRVEPSGRWPSNVVFSHDEECSDEVCAKACPIAELDRQSGETVSRVRKPRSLKAADGWRLTKTGTEYDDRGGASRFYCCFKYAARATRSERDSGLTFRLNTHPTVKPLDFMRWLVRLATPLDGFVLDPFLGSGTTALAARLEDRRIIGIEEREDYIEISRARLAAVLNKVTT